MTKNTTKGEKATKNNTRVSKIRHFAHYYYVSVSQSYKAENKKWRTYRSRKEREQRVCFCPTVLYPASHKTNPPSRSMAV